MRHSIARAFSVENGLCACAFSGDLIIVVTDVRTWTNRGTVTFIEQTVAASNGQIATTSLVHHRGEFHAAAQRRVLIEEMSKRGIPLSNRAAVLTESTLLRTVMTAWKWLTGADVAPFVPSDPPSAVRWLQQRGTRLDGPLVLRELAACYEMLEAKERRAS